MLSVSASLYDCNVWLHVSVDDVSKWFYYCAINRQRIKRKKKTTSLFSHECTRRFILVVLKERWCFKSAK